MRLITQESPETDAAAQQVVLGLEFTAELHRILHGADAHYRELSGRARQARAQLERERRLMARQAA